MFLGKKFSLLFISFLLLSGVVLAQDQDFDERPNRLSIGVMGTLTKGHMSVGSAFQSGVNANFEFQEQYNNNLGFNIRYVASPEIALQSNVVYGRFTILSDAFNDDLSLDNNYLTTSLTTQLSLLRVLGVNPRSLNIYGSFGTGLLFNSVTVNSSNPEVTQSGVSASDHPSTTFFTTFGGGVRFNLGQRIDSFAQYEYTSSSRDIVDGNFLGELLNLGGSAQTSSSWSAITVGIQFKFGSSSRDADWPSAARPPAYPALGDRDLFRELEEELIARQEAIYREEIETLRGLIDSLQANLMTEQEAQEAFADYYADTINEFQSRIDSLEHTIAQERERSEYNETQMETLTAELRAVEQQLAEAEETKQTQEEYYTGLVEELQARIEDLQQRMQETIEQAEQDVGEVIIREEEPREEVDEHIDERDVPEPDDAARMQPELQGIKDIEPETDPEDLTVTEEPADPDDDEEPEVPLREEEPPVAADEPDDEELVPDDVPEEPLPDPEYDEYEAEAETETGGAWWFILAIIALTAGGLYFLAKYLFTPAPSSPQGGAAKAASATPPPPDDEPVAPTPIKKTKLTYGMPEHTYIVKNNNGGSNSGKSSSGKGDSDK